MARITASRVSTLIEKPRAPKPMKAPITATGMVTAGISVARQERRNTKITRITNDTAMARVIITSRMEARMKMDSS